MNGKYNIKVKDNHIAYDLEIRRNISVIRGDSGTGKSTLVGMINRYQSLPNSGISIQIERIGGGKVPEIGILGYKTDWDKLCKEGKDYIFIADEYADYITNKGFVKALYESGKYLIYIGRDTTGYLDYSIDSIYKLVTNREKGKWVNRLDTIYKEVTSRCNPQVIIVEDEGSGKELLEKVFNREVISAQGKNKVAGELNRILKDGINGVYIIVDGAAFGCNIEDILSIINNNRELEIWINAPESVEYLCLNTDVFRKKFDKIRLDDILKRTENYINYKEYHNWEPFYTDLLKKCIKVGFGQNYSKSRKLPSILKAEKVLDGIRGQLDTID